ncbi:2Fe-2S iron-sulfur cluster-binding protein [Pendulispora rubella]|uniref:2Fe-2S iron-sulfur cluster-binding protein n=1 Tax=Pendulispora rubella TaxID=2741070 RepID=A0ABZ2KY54_9BACT
MPTFTYDGKTIPFEPGETIIKAAYRQGIEIPHYCWHPGLSSPANCRMCLVEIAPPPGQRGMMLDVLEWDAAIGDYKPRQKPKLQPSCQIPAAEGMQVKGDTSDNVKEARKGVQEFLLLNHPVDCPICDQSGECKLQDYWVEHGQYQKRMRDEPIHKPKAVRFGPSIVYDAERCVMCTRCIRFMDEVAKDPVLDMRERGNLNEIFVAPGKELTGHYTFMTEHVCPVGALTTVDFRFKARVWFLRTAKSVCQGCATGCNSHLDYDPRYNKVYRYRPRDNEQVNAYWMCDEGMVSYKRAHEGRLIEPRVKGSVVAVKKALAEAKSYFEAVPGETVAVVLSAQHSLEDNWALRELAGAYLGTRAIYATGLAEGYHDAILIHEDKNPNTRGVLELASGVRPFSSLLDDIEAGRVTHVIALGGETPADASAELGERAKHALERLQALVVIAAHEGLLAHAAHVLLPAASWAEASGTYVNAKGIHQVTEKAIEPQGASEPAWKLVADVGQALGYDTSWTKLKQVRARWTSAPTVPDATAVSPSPQASQTP